MKQYGPVDHDDQDYAAAITVGTKSGPDAEEARWTLLLTLFFRVVALLWMIEGLDHWRRILVPAVSSFLDLSDATAAAVVFFAIFDLVAAVGLWLVAPWGGVVWLLTLMAQLYVAAIKPAFFPGGPAVKLVDGALLALYLLLSWRANRAGQDARGGQESRGESRGAIRSAIVGAIGALNRLLAWTLHMVKREKQAR